MNGKLVLIALSRDALMSLVKDTLGESAFRAAQIRQKLNLGASIDEMNNLPRTLREKLSQIAVANPVSIREIFKSKLDDTEKFLFELSDGNLIEGVLMRYHYGDTLCVSSQVGCRMGCAFCASTLEGRVRNLSVGEILGQVFAVNRHLMSAGGERRVHNIVLMGSGEPFDNYDNVVTFLRRVNDPEGLNISIRNISLSTCGLVPQIRRFTQEGLPLTLSLSLHAPNDAIRRKLMPVANAFEYDDVLSAVREYSEKTGRRVVFEYALVKNLNCEVRHAEELARRLRGMRCHVNLIPLNEVKERNLEAPEKQEVAAFLKRLELKNISATVRREMGADIQGACGQLRRSYIARKQ